MSAMDVPAELQWMLLRNTSSFLVKRDGVAFSREPSNLVKKHSFKYCGLVQPSIIMESTPEGITIRRQSTKVPANKVAARYPTTVTIKKSASGGSRAARLARDMQAAGFRPDLVRAAQARLCALLDAEKPRKASVSKNDRRKLAQ